MKNVSIEAIQTSDLPPAVKSSGLYGGIGELPDGTAIYEFDR